jgi:DUF971 family protein
MTPEITPTRLDLKKDEKLEIQWQDGTKCTYTLDYLRSLCPCAHCKQVRQAGGDKPRKPTSLAILPGNYATPLRVVSAELVGNYALRIDWSDDHGSGIYSFEYLRSISGPAQRS